MGSFVTGIGHFAQLYAQMYNKSFCSNTSLVKQSNYTTLSDCWRFSGNLAYNKLAAKMKKMFNWYNKQATHKKIGIAVIVNLIIMVLLISVSLIVDYKKVRESQMEMPDSFFRVYKNDSLKLVALHVKQTILGAVDERLSWSNCIRNNIDKNPPEITGIQAIKVNASYSESGRRRVRCYFSNPEATIFSCNMNSYMKSVIEAGWPSQSSRQTRRINVIYQNIKNETDVMIQSISDLEDFTIKNISRITNKFRALSEDNFQFSSSYPDQYGVSPQQLVSFDIKAVFEGYQVMIELETYGNFITVPIQRIVYTDDTNVIVLIEDSENENGYNVVVKTEDLNPQIDYKELLEPGHHQTVLGDRQTIYSYTTTLSSLYNLGSLNSLFTREVNQKYRLVVHTSSITLKAQASIYAFIQNLYTGLREILIVFFAILVMLVGLNSANLAYMIGRRMKIMLLCLRNYNNNSPQYETSQLMLRERMNEFWMGPVMRNVYEILKNVEANRRKSRRLAQSVKSDSYPLNLLGKAFVKSQRCKDIQNFEAIKGLLVMSAQRPASLTSLAQKLIILTENGNVFF